MNGNDRRHEADRAAHSRSASQAFDSAAIQAAAATMHKIAAVSRGLKSVGTALEQMVQAASGRGDLTLPHWLIVVYLSGAEIGKQSELNLETGMTAGYLTRLLDELDAEGMIRRNRSTEDRRQILLSLTDVGRDAALALLAAIDQRRLPGALDELKSSLDGFLSI